MCSGYYVQQPTHSTSHILCIKTSLKHMQFWYNFDTVERAVTSLQKLGLFPSIGLDCRTRLWTLGQSLRKSNWVGSSSSWNLHRLHRHYAIYSKTTHSCSLAQRKHLKHASNTLSLKLINTNTPVKNRKLDKLTPMNKDSEFRLVVPSWKRAFVQRLPIRFILGLYWHYGQSNTDKYCREWHYHLQKRCHSVETEACSTTNNLIALLLPKHDTLSTKCYVPIDFSTKLCLLIFAGNMLVWPQMDVFGRDIRSHPTICHTVR